MTIASERWLNQVLLVAAGSTSSGAAIVDTFALPPTLGDVAIMCVEVTCTAIDVLTADVEQAVRLAIVRGATIVDLVGIGVVKTIYDAANALQVGVLVDPDALVIWHQGELLSLIAPEIDTDATPLAAWTVRAKVVRVPPGTPALPEGPIRLVS